MTAARTIGRILVALLVAVVASLGLGLGAASAATTTTPATTAPAGPSPTAPGTPTIATPAIPGIATPSVPKPSDSVRVSVDAPAGTNNPVLIVVVVTLISMLPGLLMVATTFPRFLIVLGLARQALGLNQTPPNQVLTGLAAFLTLFAMAPVFSKINDVALQPALKGQKTQAEAVKDGWVPLRDYLLDHTRTQDLALFQDMSGDPKPASPDKVSPRVLVPAYIISELRAAFTIGFLVWVPFLLIDLLVSSLLSAMGMMMMPPVVISLPVKLVLFVLVDGWALLVGSLLRSVT